MYLIDEEYNPIVNPIGSHYWVYDLAKKDFFLRKGDVWYSLFTDVYRLKVGNGECVIPATYHIVIGDYDGGLDIIKPDEMVGRPFEAFAFNSNMEEGSWTLQDVSIIGFEEDVELVYPVVNNPVPIDLGNGKNILVSPVDIYSKLRKLNFSEIV